MGRFKRNAVVITVVLFVCAAAYLNWSYGNAETPAEDAGAALPEYTETEGDEGLYYASEPVSQTSEYFASARINRQQARDAAVETLASVNAAEGASQEVVDGALDKIAKIAADSQREAELEALIMAKGFRDCVVFLSDDGVKVTVPAPEAGLASVEVAKITDIVTAETGCKAADLKVIEVKN
jgi:stage III sporulation protein AH